MKLLVLLRDPVVRAYSGHSHEKARGFEDLSFEEALAAEPARIAGERERLMADPGYDSFHWQHHAYVTRGQYIEQLRALEQLVGRERHVRRRQRRLLRRPRAGLRRGPRVPRAGAVRRHRLRAAQRAAALAAVATSCASA